jgi:hypothetical protein
MPRQRPTKIEIRVRDDGTFYTTHTLHGELPADQVDWIRTAMKALIGVADEMRISFSRDVLTPIEAERCNDRRPL